MIKNEWLRRKLGDIMIAFITWGSFMVVWRVVAPEYFYIAFEVLFTPVVYIGVMLSLILQTLLFCLGELYAVLTPLFEVLFYIITFLFGLFMIGIVPLVIMRHLLVRDPRKNKDD